MPVDPRSDGPDPPGLSVRAAASGAFDNAGLTQVRIESGRIESLIDLLLGAFPFPGDPATDTALISDPRTSVRFEDLHGQGGQCRGPSPRALENRDV